MKKKKTIIILLAAVLSVFALISYGVLAFFMHKDEVVNTITVGKVSIALYEDKYPGNANSDVNNMLPYTEIDKNPKVENTGTTSAYVFLKVSVPVEEITEVSADGTKGDKKAQEIFYLKTDKTLQTTLINSFYTDNWIELNDEESGTDYKAGTVRTYIFGYKKALSVGKQTDVLFDKVQLKNFIENEILSGSDLHIDIQALGIQSEYLGKDFPTENLTDAQLTEIYQCLK